MAQCDEMDGEVPVAARYFVAFLSSQQDAHTHTERES